jgi:hypothetical protein
VPTLYGHLDAKGQGRLMDRIPGSLLKVETPAKLQKLLDAAATYRCAHCNRDDGTVVAAHCNELALGRGFAHKTPNYLVAYLCHDCHDAVDGRAHALSKDEKRAMWNRAYAVTVSWWFRDGLVRVA